MIAAHRPGMDRGMTLIEVVVTTSIMAIAAAMVTTGIIQIYSSMNRNEAIAEAQSQVNRAFLRLDKEIRYAAGISSPGTVAFDPYVEYLISNSGTPTCVELRLHLLNKQLQRRTWTDGSSPVAPSRWLPLASNVSSGQPFTVLAADPTFTFQRLRLDLSASAGTGANATSREVDVTFTALNTSLATASDTVCAEGRSVP